MKRVICTCFGLLLGASILYGQQGEHKKIVTKEFLKQQDSTWVIINAKVEADSLFLELGDGETKAYIEQIGKDYYLYSEADYFCALGSKHIIIAKCPEIVLNNQEVDAIYKVAEKRKDVPYDSRPLPRPFHYVNKEKNSKEIVFQSPESPSNVFGRLFIRRDWRHLPPNITLELISDNGSYYSDPLFKDSTYVYQDNSLELAAVLVEKDNRGPSIKIESVSVDDNTQNINADRHDWYSSSKSIIIPVNKQISNVKTIKVTYSYLDNNLEKKYEDALFFNKPANKSVYNRKKTAKEHPLTNATRKPADVLLILSCVLLGLMLLFSAFLALSISRMNNKKDGTADKYRQNRRIQEGPEPTNSFSDSNLEKINNLKATIDKALGPKKDYETYSELVQRQAARLKEIERASLKVFSKPEEGESYEDFFKSKLERAAQFERLIEKYFGPKPRGMYYSQYFDIIKKESEADQKNLERLHESIKQEFGEPDNREEYSDFIRRKVEELKGVSNLVDLYLRRPKGEETYESVVKAAGNKVNTLDNLSIIIKEDFGQPQADEGVIDLFRRVSQERKEILNQQVQKSLEALQKQKEDLEKEHIAIVTRLNGELDSAETTRKNDLQLFCSTQHVLLNRVREAYGNCTKYIGHGSKFGEYTKHFGMPLIAFIEMAEATYNSTDEKDTVAEVIERIRPSLQKALDDHTSWLNAITRLEAYSRAECIRKHMLKEGIQLASLTNMFYAMHEFLSNNQFTLAALPELFYETDNIDEYECDNMDIVISSLFDYEEEVQSNAIVDIIRIGYTFKNEPAVKTTVAYYSKPKA